MKAKTMFYIAWGLLLAIASSLIAASVALVRLVP